MLAVDVPVAVMASEESEKSPSKCTEVNSLANKKQGGFEQQDHMKRDLTHQTSHPRAGAGFQPN